MLLKSLLLQAVQMSKQKLSTLQNICHAVELAIVATVEFLPAAKRLNPDRLSTVSRTSIEISLGDLPLVPFK